jgi:glycosyltransferase A (GT-A) superfamily protein (DUF2064 family)
MSTREYTAEGAWKLAEIMALGAEQDAQHLRKLYDWYEKYAPQQDITDLGNRLDKAEAEARAAEDRATQKYEYWKDIADWA